MYFNSVKSGALLAVVKLLANVTDIKTLTSTLKTVSQDYERSCLKVISDPERGFILGFYYFSFLRTGLR